MRDSHLGGVGWCFIQFSAVTEQTFLLRSFG